MEIMHESRKIFLVTTSELSSLHLAQENLQYLQRMDLGNRSVSSSTARSNGRRSPAEVEQIVGAPVMMTFPNDYPRVTRRPLRTEKRCGAPSELGRSLRRTGSVNVELTAESKVESKRRFVEYFNISPARFSPGTTLSFDFRRARCRFSALLECML